MSSEHIMQQAQTPTHLTQLAQKRDEAMELLLHSPIEVWRQAKKELFDRHTKFLKDSTKHIQDQGLKVSVGLIEQYQEQNQQLLDELHKWDEFIRTSECIRMTLLLRGEMEVKPNVKQ